MKAVDRKARQIVERMAAGVDASRQRAAAYGCDELGTRYRPAAGCRAPKSCGSGRIIRTTVKVKAMSRVGLQYGDHVRFADIPDADTAARIEDVMLGVDGTFSTDFNAAVLRHNSERIPENSVLGIDSRDGEVWSMPRFSFGASGRTLTVADVLAYEDRRWCADNLELQFGDYVRLDRIPDLHTAKRIEAALATVSGAYPATDGTDVESAYTDDGRLKPSREHCVLSIDSRSGEIWTIPGDSGSLRRELGPADVLRVVRPNQQSELDADEPANSNSVTIVGDGWSAHIGTDIRIEAETDDGRRAGLEAARRWLSHGMADAFADLES